MAGVYVNPFTDFGFKKIFGEEASKPILLDFLNALLGDEEGQITELWFKNNEQLGHSGEAKGVIFDIYCEKESGEKFIVELQKNKQDWFKERAVYYATFPIQEQVTKGDPKYELKAVYCIGILDFIFIDFETQDEKTAWKHEIKLKNQFGNTFYDKLTFLFLVMPNFNKKEEELYTRLDKWLYFIKNLDDFQTIPQIFKNEVVFTEAFKKAEIAKMTVADFYIYQRNMRAFMDYDGIRNYDLRITREKAIEETTIKVEKETMIKIAKAMIDIGVEIKTIIQSTGLTEDEINDI